MIADVVNTLRKSLRGERSLLGNAAVVASGHALGAALTVAAAPILSRLYSPEAFGVMSVFLALATVVAFVATLRYDQAIPLPQHDHAAASLAVLAGTLAAGVAGILLVAAVIGEAPLNRLLANWPLPNDTAALLAAAVAAIAVFQITSAWMVRTRDYGQLARIRLVYIVSALVVQLAVPWLFVAGATGLISGQIAGYGLAGLFAAWSLRHTPARIQLHRAHRLDHLAIEYRNYPLFDVAAALASSIALFGPAVLLAFLFGAEVAGWFTLAHRLLASPLGLLSHSISRVYFAEAARLGKQDHAALRRLFRGTLRRVALVAVPPVIAVALVAPFTFSLIFGPQWQPVGTYFALLAPMVLAFVFAVVVAPTLDVVGRQGLKFVREALCVTLIAAGIAVPHAVGWSATAAIATTSALGTASYLLAIAVTWSAISTTRTADEPIACEPESRLAA